MLVLSDIHESWKDFIDRKDIQKILTSIESDIGNDYYPSKENVLRFLKIDLNNVKYIIMGMDPYPSYYVKDGHSFSVATGRSFEPGNLFDWNDKTKNKSIINILKSIYMVDNEEAKISIIRNKIYKDEFEILKPRDLFDNLESQGVLFLNYALTVKPNKPGSHIEIWKEFNNKLNEYIYSKNNNITWVLWGYVVKKNIKLPKGANYIENCHPRNNSFIYKNNFKDMDDINWNGKSRIR